jgi:hypothetical protein
MRRDYGFLSVGTRMTRGAAWLITGWTFFGFFFSRFGAFLFPMPTACHGFELLARENELHPGSFKLSHNPESHSL